MGSTDRCVPRRLTHVPAAPGLLMQLVTCCCLPRLRPLAMHVHVHGGMHGAQGIASGYPLAGVAGPRALFGADKMPPGTLVSVWVGVCGCVWGGRCLLSLVLRWRRVEASLCVGGVRAHGGACLHV